MSKVKEETISIGKPTLSAEAEKKFDDAAKMHGKSQKTFLEACQLGMRDMKKWSVRWGNDAEERSFETVKELAKDICYKHMSEGQFSSFCTTTRKLLHYGLKDWTTAKTTVDVLDEAKTIVDASKDDEGTYGDEHLTYEQAMKKEVTAIKEKNRLEKLANKVPIDLDCVAPTRGQFDTAEEFYAAVWAFFNFYLNHEELENFVEDEEDAARIKKITAKHAPAAAVVADPVLV